MNAPPLTDQSPPAAPADVVGTSCSWRWAGSGGATPAILLHGLLGSRRAWEPQLAALSADRTVLAWDAPGYGSSAGLDEPTLAAYADAVARCADEAGFDRFHLVGLSFGGMIAQHAALRLTDRLVSLSLLSSSPKFGFDGVTTAESWRAARLAPLDAGRRPIDFAPDVLRAISGPAITDGALAGEIRAAELVTDAGLRAAIDALITHDTREALAQIDVPALCIVGDADAETPVAYSRFLAEHLPDARLEVVAGAGHLVHVEAADAVNRLLAEHFTRTEAADD